MSGETSRDELFDDQCAKGLKGFNETMDLRAKIEELTTGKAEADAALKLCIRSAIRTAIMLLVKNLEIETLKEQRAHARAYCARNGWDLDLSILVALDDHTDGDNHE